MKLEDKKLIERLKLKLIKSFPPSNLKELLKHNITSLESLSPLLSGNEIYEYLKKIPSNLIIENPRAIFYTILKLWLDDLMHELNMLKTSKELTRFIQGYIGRYEIDEIINCMRHIRLGKGKLQTYFIPQEVTEMMCNCRGINDIFKILI